MASFTVVGKASVHSPGSCMQSCRTSEGTAPARGRTRKPRLFSSCGDRLTQQTDRVPLWKVQKPVNRCVHPRLVGNQLSDGKFTTLPTLPWWRLPPQLLSPPWAGRGLEPTSSGLLGGLLERLVSVLLYPSTASPHWPLLIGSWKLRLEGEACVMKPVVYLRLTDTNKS